MKCSRKPSQKKEKGRNAHNKKVHLTPKAGLLINIELFEMSWLFRNYVDAFGAGDRRR